MIPAAEENRAEAPRWLPGDYWNYVNGNGLWRNASVVAEETFNGQSTYHVRTIFSMPDEFAVTYEDCWFDPQSLGMDGCEDSSHFRAQATTPMAQIFPMHSRTYDTTISMSYFPPVNATYEYHVGEVELATVPLGTGSCVHLHTSEVKTNETSQLACYSFSVHNYLFYDHKPNEDQMNDIYRLASWGRKTS